MSTTTTCASCGVRPTGAHTHFGLFCEPCGALPYGFYACGICGGTVADGETCCRPADGPVCGCCELATIPPMEPGEEGFYCEGCGTAWQDPTAICPRSCMLHRIGGGPMTAPVEHTCHGAYAFDGRTPGQRTEQCPRCQWLAARPRCAKCGTAATQLVDGLELCWSHAELHRFLGGAR